MALEEAWLFLKEQRTLLKNEDETFEAADYRPKKGEDVMGVDEEGNPYSMRISEHGIAVDTTGMDNDERRGMEIHSNTSDEPACEMCYATTPGGYHNHPEWMAETSHEMDWVIACPDCRKKPWNHPDRKLEHGSVWGDHGKPEYPPGYGGEGGIAISPAHEERVRMENGELAYNTKPHVPFEISQEEYDKNEKEHDDRGKAWKKKMGETFRRVFEEQAEEDGISYDHDEEMKHRDAAWDRLEQNVKDAIAGGWVDPNKGLMERLAESKRKKQTGVKNQYASNLIGHRRPPKE